MNLLTIYSRFPDQESCIEHLENVRWADRPDCPFCHSEQVGRKADGDRIGRWNCHACHRSYNVLSGTIFSKTKVDLQRWFLAIGLMVNAKKSLSSYQLGRDLSVTQQTALFMQHRIRAAMAADQGTMLQGILEADETYVGGKPRYNHPGNKRGRGTRKTPVLGVVERGGEVAAQVSDNTTGKSIMAFIKRNVVPDGSFLITDEYRAYNAISKLLPHAVIDHQQGYVHHGTHTNTIEGFWALLKRAWYGSHHHYHKQYMPLFVAESAWKYNHRRDANGFGSFIRGCFQGCFD